VVDYFWLLLKNYKSSPKLLGYFFSMVQLCKKLTKRMGWATFWAIFSQTIPFTLIVTDDCLHNEFRTFGRRLKMTPMGLFLAAMFFGASPPPRPSIFSDYSFRVRHLVNRDDRHLLAHAVASDLTVSMYVHGGMLRISITFNNLSLSRRVISKCPTS
jgi:hypothetical protein